MGMEEMGSGMEGLKRVAVDSAMFLIGVLVLLYDIITQPIYYFKHQVYRKQREVDQVEHSRQLDPYDASSPWFQPINDTRQTEIERRVDAFLTYDDMMRHSFQANAQHTCYGYRQVLEEHWSKRADNSDKPLRRVELSDYHWLTYGQFDEQIEAARKGFLVEGIRPGHKVMLYADTRPEWQIASQALIRLGAIVGTMYSTLGVDGIVHSMNETQVSHVVTAKDKVNKLLRLHSRLPKLSKIIYFEPVLTLPRELLPASAQALQQQQQQQHKSTSNNNNNSSEVLANGTSDTSGAQDEQQPDFEHPQVKCLRFRDVLASGLKLSVEEEAAIMKESPRKKDKHSIAVIMYTSGSTGIPKGVLISHGNIMANIKSFSGVTRDFIHRPRENVCAAYLPLAHIFEFCIESVMLFHGVKFGFATPQTLTDASPGLMPGQRGDLVLLKPTVMVIVPLILDRVVQGIKKAIKQQSYFMEQFLSYLIRYKIYWQKKYYETPLVDRIVCKKMAQALGGRAKYVICGSAPLSEETQTFVRATLNLKLPQGFGTTETCAATSCQLFEDQSTGNVGVPVWGAQIKLEPWLEGNYRPTDKPHPRGEIVVGGEMIAQGYFNLDELTEECFYVDENNVRWYRTGDIGEFLANGNLRIIDRKKDLVKLQNGEYISLGKVEATLKSNPYTDNLCAFVNSNYNYVVALGPANEASIRKLAEQVVEEWQRKSPTSARARQPLIASGDGESIESALEEIKQVLQQYETDRLNNNSAELDRNKASELRKMSTLSNKSVGSDCCQQDERLAKLCNNQLIKERVLEHMRQLALERNLLTLEVPRKLMLLAEEWTEDKNLVTAALKIRRNYIYKRYERELDQLYGI